MSGVMGRLRSGIRKYLFTVVISSLAYCNTTISTHASEFGQGLQCCKDLDQRVADLEAATARTGNRKVNVEVFGIVNWAVDYWNDGDISNVYVQDNYDVNSRIGFRGSVEINPDWTAGYVLEIGTRKAISSTSNQFDSSGTNDLFMRHSHLFFEGRRFGTLRFGLTSTAMDDVTWLAIPVARLNFANAQDFTFNRNFFLRSKGVKGTEGLSPITFGDIGRCYSLVDAFDCSNRREAATYWTPVYGGLQLGASWSSGAWSLGAKYKADWGEAFTIAFDAGFENITNDEIGIYFGGGGHHIRDLAGSATIMHNPTGLYLYYAGTHSEMDDPITRHAGIYTGTSMPDMNGFDVQAGLHREFFDIGPTTLFGGFNRVKDGIGGASDSPDRLLDPGTFFDVNIPTEITGSSVDRWYVGFDQALVDNIHVYVTFQHFEPSVNLVDSARSKVSAPLSDFDVLYAGGYVVF